MGIHIVKELQIITLMGHDAYLYNISTFSFLLLLRKTFLPLGHHPGFQVEGYQNLNYYSYNIAFHAFYDSRLKASCIFFGFVRSVQILLLAQVSKWGIIKNICLYEIHQILKVHLRPGRDLNYCGTQFPISVQAEKSCSR